MTKDPWKDLASQPKGDTDVNLSTFISDEQVDVGRVTEILDGIPGAWECAQESIQQAQRRETLSLSEL
jgi:hypothetical protein